MTAPLDRFVRDQFVSLRAEFLLRVLLQNLTLMLHWVFLAATLAVIHLTDAGGAPVVIGFGCLTLAMAATWTHSGRRQVQIRAYLKEVHEPLAGDPAVGWEHFLDRRRIAARSGALWRASTMAYWLLAPLVALGFAWHRGHAGIIGALLQGGIVILLLFTLRHPPVTPESDPQVHRLVASSRRAAGHPPSDPPGA